MPAGSAAMRSPSNEPSTNSELVRSLVVVPSRDTKPAPETPINQAIPWSVERSRSSAGRNTWQAIARTNAALRPCTVPMMKAMMRGVSFSGEEISP